MTLALILLRLKSALPFVKRNWKAFALLAFVVLIYVAGCSLRSAGYRAGVAAEHARCEQARRDAEKAIDEAVAAAYEKGKEDAAVEGAALQEREVEIRTVTRDVVRRIEVPIERVVTVRECPLDEMALEEIRSTLNQQRARVR